MFLKNWFECSNLFLSHIRRIANHNIKAAFYPKHPFGVEEISVGVLVVGILVTLLRVPYEANKQKMNATSEMPVMQLFNQGYEKSILSPLLVRGAPYFLQTLKPMLPPQIQEKGAVPLLESIVAQQTELP